MADDKESLLDDVNEAFRKFDSNQDGFLTAHDVKMMFELMDFRLNSKDFQEFFACGDTSGTDKFTRFDPTEDFGSWKRVSLL